MIENITKLEMKRIFKIFCFIGITLLVSISCRRTIPPSERLRSILVSEPGCSAPCWRTIVPGKSTEEDFFKLIEGSPSNAFDDMKQSPLRPEGIEYGWDDNMTGFFSNVRIYSNEVTLISFLSEYRDFTLSMITEALGQPNAYGMSVLGSEDFFVLLTMVYEKDGVVIETSFPLDIYELQEVKATCEYLDFRQSKIKGGL